MKDLYIIDEQFPTIGICKNSMCADVNKLDKNYASTNHKFNKPYVSIRSISLGCSHPNDDTATCECPQRTTAPSRPQSLPFQAVPENNDKMRQWLLGR